MEYKILRASNNDLTNAVLELTQLVNKELEGGWKPQGGVSVSLLTVGQRAVCVVFQAITRE